MGKKWFGSILLSLVGVLALFALAGADDPKGLIAHWKLTGDCGDHSGNDLHGTNHGAVLAADGARFDGRDDFIEVPAHPKLRLGARDFAISLWAHTAEDLADVLGDLVSQYDPARRRGFTFGTVTNAGVTSCQSNYRNLHFGIDHGKGKLAWRDRGRPGDAVYIHALAVHDGQLYAGTCEPGKDQAGHVFRFQEPDRWIDAGSPDRSNAVLALAVYRGQLYAGTGKYRLGGSALPESENMNLGGKIYRFANGKWLDCGQLPGVEAVGGLVEYRGKLYASSLYRPAGFFRYEGGEKWTGLPTPGKRVEALAVYNGYLWATSYDQAHVFRFDGKDWTDCGQLGDMSNTQTYAFAVHQGHLYCGTWRSGRVYRYAADHKWIDAGRLGEELEVMGMAVYNGKLYAGTLPLAEVYRYDGGTTWTNTGQVDRTPNVRYRRAAVLAEYRGQLFCGTLPSARVLSLEAGKCVSSDRELGAGWKHLAAVREKDRLKLYVDGKLAATSTPFDPAEFDLSNDAPLRIGFGEHDYFNGRMRDVRLYDRALTADELTGLARK